jgi:glycosyltransferase involved in cell wall biosynthesis
VNGRFRILLVELTEDDSIGGSHRALADLVTHLDRGTFEPVVGFHQANPYVDEFRSAGIEVHLLGTRSYPATRHPSRLDRAARMVRVIRERTRFLRQVGADLVHVNNSPHGGYDDWLIPARLAGLPCVTHARGFPWPGATRRARLLSRRFDRVLAISESIQRAWQAAGIPAHRLTRVPDGVDVERIRGAVRRPASDVRAELDLGPEGILITMVGHLRTWKGQDVLLRALAELVRRGEQRVHAALVGGPTNSEDETYIALLHRIVRDEGLESRVRFLGARSDAADYMNAADIVVHASTRPEPFGLVVLEAMALGKPVIASKLGGPSEVIRPETGLLFDPADSDALAGLLERLAADAGERERLAAGGRALVLEYDIRRTVAAVEGVYRDLLRRRVPRR